MCQILGTSWRGCSHVLERHAGVRLGGGGISLCKRSTACAAAHCSRYGVAPIVHIGYSSLN